MADVLVIDDDPRVRAALIGVIAGSGHSARGVEDGKAALAAIRERVPDVVVSDVYMPEMDGLEVLMRVRKEHPSVRIIVASGGGNIEAADVLSIAQSLGADVTLQKPVRPADLRAAIESVL